MRRSRGALLWRRIWAAKYLYLMFLPVFFYYVIFRYAPMLGLSIAFKNFNAFLGSMAAAAWLVRDEMTAGGEKTFLLEVSGAPEPVPCRIRALESGYEGTAEMPPVREIREVTMAGIPFTLVRTDGIAHLVHEGRPLEKDEDLLREIAGILPDDAIGLLQWDREISRMEPLVYVRESGSLVRETGCGSGSAAVGAVEALRDPGDGSESDDLRRNNPYEETACSGSCPVSGSGCFRCAGGRL